LNAQRWAMPLGIFIISAAVFTCARMRIVGLCSQGEDQARFLTGDEPAYLLLAHSAAVDRDFNLYNNRVDKDGRFFGVPQCEGHGARKDWEKKEIYSIHTPGVSILVAPAYALALRLGVSPRAVVCVFMNLLAALLAVNVWLFCRDIQGRDIQGQTLTIHCRPDRAAAPFGGRRGAVFSGVAVCFFAGAGSDSAARG